MRILFTAEELDRLRQLTEIAARTQDMIFAELAKVSDRLNLQWDPDEGGTEGIPVREILDEFSSDPESVTPVAVADAYGTLFAWSAPKELHLNIESTSQGQYVLMSNGAVLTTPAPTIHEAQQGMLILQGMGGSAWTLPTQSN